MCDFSFLFIVICCQPWFSLSLLYPVWFMISLTLGAHAQRGLQYLVCVCVCVCVVCVCVSVSQHLTFGASVCLENAVTYSTGNEGQKICGDFFKNSPFLFYGVICVSQQRVRLYYVFVTTEAFSIRKKANDIQNTTRNTSQWVKWQLKPSTSALHHVRIVVAHALLTNLALALLQLSAEGLHFSAFHV